MFVLTFLKYGTVFLKSPTTWMSTRASRLVAGMGFPDVAAALVDDLIAIARRPEDVVVSMVRDLARLLRLQVVLVEIQLSAFTIGREVDRVADPHRLVVGRRIAGDLLALVRSEVVDPDVLRASAAIALPCAELALDRRVDDLRSVGRVHAAASLGNRQRRFHSAARRDD